MRYFGNAHGRKAIATVTALTIGRAGVAERATDDGQNP